MKELLPQSTGGLYSIGTGVLLVGLGVAGLLGWLSVSGDKAVELIMTGSALIGTHQLRRGIEAGKEPEGDV